MGTSGGTDFDGCGIVAKAVTQDTSRAIIYWGNQVGRIVARLDGLGGLRRSDSSYSLTVPFCMLPGELRGALDEAEGRAAFLTKKMARAKDKLEEANQARVYFAKRDAGQPPRKD